MAWCISAFAQDEGISAIANRGKVLVQAQEDDIAVNAQKNLHLSAAEGEVVITAATIRLVADAPGHDGFKVAEYHAVLPSSSLIW